MSVSVRFPSYDEMMAAKVANSADDPMSMNSSSCPPEVDRMIMESVSELCNHEGPVDDPKTVTTNEGTGIITDLSRINGANKYGFVITDGESPTE